MKRFAKACAAVSMALMMSTAVGFAAETDHGTTNKAAVSDEVDTALNITPKMGTKFTVYLAPDIPETIPIVHEIPKMGDVGIDQKTLLEALLVAGGCYLVSDGVATACKGKRKDDKAATPA